MGFGWTRSPSLQPPPPPTNQPNRAYKVEANTAEHGNTVDVAEMHFASLRSERGSSKIHRTEHTHTHTLSLSLAHTHSHTTLSPSVRLSVCLLASLSLPTFLLELTAKRVLPKVRQKRRGPVKSASCMMAGSVAWSGWRTDMVYCMEFPNGRFISKHDKGKELIVSICSRVTKTGKDNLRRTLDLMLPKLMPSSVQASGDAQVRIMRCPRLPKVRPVPSLQQSHLCQSQMTFQTRRFVIERS